ncbi:MAG: stage II sporulation protein M [Candidatus Micrarchaeia archaeon]
MVFELMISPHKAEREPWDLAVLAFLFVSLAIAINILIPGLDGNIVAFAMIPAIPLIWALLIRDEKNEEEFYRHKRSFFDYHWNLIEIFSFFFIGAVLAFTVWYAILPIPASQTIFSAQLNEIQNIKNATTGMAFKPEFFQFLFQHNLQVLALMFIFSVMYAIGSIYLLLWNASIIGVFVGSKIHTEGVIGVVNGLLGLIPHGSLELGGYFIASIAGGILSVAITHKCWKHSEFKYIMRDIAILTVISVMLVGVGALVESSY